MNYYELMVVIHSALEGGRLKDIINSVVEQLKKHSSESLYTDIWGKKKLAYLIDKQKYGTYVLIQFKGDGKGNADLLVELEHNPNVLTYLISSISENDIMEQSDNIDDQISRTGGSTTSDNSTEATEETVDDSAEATEETVDDSAEATEETVDDSAEAIEETVDDSAEAEATEETSDDSAEATEETSDDSAEEATEEIKLVEVEESTLTNGDDNGTDK